MKVGLLLLCNQRKLGQGQHNQSKGDGRLTISKLTSQYSKWLSTFGQERIKNITNNDPSPFNDRNVFRDQKGIEAVTDVHLGWMSDVGRLTTGQNGLERSYLTIYGPVLDWTFNSYYIDQTGIDRKGEMTYTTAIYDRPVIFSDFLWLFISACYLDQVIIYCGIDLSGHWRICYDWDYSPFWYIILSPSTGDSQLGWKLFNLKEDQHWMDFEISQRASWRPYKDW